MRPAKILPKELLATCKISNHHRRPVLPPVRFAGMTYGMGSNEHTLEQHACFKEYLTLYEDRLADYIGNTFALGSGVGGGPGRGACENHLCPVSSHLSLRDISAFSVRARVGLPEKDPNGPRASITDFYTELAEAKDTGCMDAGTQEFIHCLVASADYDSFYSVRPCHRRDNHSCLISWTWSAFDRWCKTSAVARVDSTGHGTRGHET